MSNICRSICQASTNVNSLLKAQIFRFPVYVQDRYKSQQTFFYGLKNYWPKYTMMKDQRKRMTMKEYGPAKLRINAIRRVDFLPIEIREIADHEINTLPVDVHHTRIVHRCLVTSKSRGTVLPFNLGRHLFRHLADDSKLCGVQRAMW